MRIIEVQQGSAEWHAARASHDCASDAPAMMGESMYKTRSELMAEKKFGAEKEHDAATLRRFADGHETEAKARVIAEAMLGQDLFPVVCVSDDDKLLASVDGMTMNEDILFEHKLINASLAKDVHSGELKPHYYWQLEHQLLVTGAEKVLFICSDGTTDNIEHMEYVSVPTRRAALIAGWEQFHKDLETFEMQQAKAEVVGRAPEQLPALRIEISGAVQASNLADFKAAAVAVFGNIKKDLVTDEDFADAEKTVKWCSDVESKLDAAKQHALSQTSTIDELFRAIDEIKESARQTRLNLEKKVKAEKEARKNAVVMKYQGQLVNYCNELRTSVGVPFPVAPITDAAKGLKTLASIEEKMSVALMKAKLEANEIASRIEANRKVMDQFDAGTLFPDFAAAALRPEEDFANLVKARVDQRREAEERRKQQEEAHRQAAPVVAPGNLLDQRDQALEKLVKAQNVTPIATQDTGRTMKMGDICNLLGVIVNADFLSSLGIQPIKVDRAAKLYRESDFPMICDAIARHITNVGVAHKAKVAA